MLFPPWKGCCSFGQHLHMGWTEPWHNIQEAGGQVGIWDHRPSFPQQQNWERGMEEIGMRFA